MKNLKILMLLSCLLSVLLSVPVFGYSNIEYEISEADRIISVVGKIEKTSEEGETKEPIYAYITAKNKTVDSTQDRRGGLRYIDSCLCGADGAFSFAFFAIDGGDYEIKVTEKSGNTVVEKHIQTEDLYLDVTGGGTVGKRANVILTFPDCISDYPGAVQGKFSVTYDAQLLEPTPGEAVKGNEKITVTETEKSDGIITVSYTINSKAAGAAAIQIFFKSIKAPENDSSEIGLPSFELLNRFGENIAINYKNTYSLKFVSADVLNHAMNAAISALEKLPLPKDITGAAYLSVRVLADNAETRINEAVAQGAVIEEDFSSELIGMLALVNERLNEMKPDMERLTAINGATGDALYTLIKQNNQLFKITPSAFTWLDKLDNKADILLALSNHDVWENEELRQYFEETVILYGLKELAWGNIEAFLTDMNWDNGIMLSGDYRNVLNDSQRITVQKELAKKGYTTLSELREAFITAVSSVQKKTITSGAPSGGGGKVTNEFAAAAQPVFQISPENQANDSKSFSDVEGFEWAIEGIKALSDAEIISGDGDGRFRPSEDITRAEFVKLMMKALGVVSYNSERAFDDVKKEDWFYPYAMSAVELKIVSGMGDNRFGANEKITRQDMAVMLSRCLKYLKADIPAGNETFNDFDDASSYAREALSCMKNSGIMNGIGDNFFMPHETVNRAMAAKVIYSIYNMQRGASQ